MTTYQRLKRRLAYRRTRFEIAALTGTTEKVKHEANQLIQEVSYAEKEFALNNIRPYDWIRWSMSKAEAQTRLNN